MMALQIIIEAIESKRFGFEKKIPEFSNYEMPSQLPYVSIS